MSRRAPLRWYIRFGDPRKVEGGVSVVHDPEAYAYAEEPALRVFEPGDTPPSLRSEAGISAYDVLARGRERIVFHVPVGLWTFSGQMENFLEKRVMDDDVWLFRGRAKAAWGTDGEPLVDASTVRDVRRVGTKHLWVTERKEHTTPSPSWKRMLDLFTAWELERLHDGGYNEFFRKKPKDVSRKEITDYIGALRLRFTTPQQQRALDDVETLWLQQWDEDHRATARANPRRRNPRNPQTDTPTSSAAFRRWFGNSKVVDARGEPLVVYHAGFDVLRSPEGAFRLSEYGRAGMGIYFAPSLSGAERYLGRARAMHHDHVKIAEYDGLPIPLPPAITAVYLSIQNPAIVDRRTGLEPSETLASMVVPKRRYRNLDYELEDLLRYTRKAGYDGVFVVDENGVDEIVVFDPRQVKSATGNRGTFDPADPDIRHNPRRAYTSAMRTDPELWEEVKAEVTRGSKGGKPGQWSARKAQLAVALYKQRGGDYYGPKSPYNALAKWTREDWRTKSGRPSLETGERYLPAAAIAALTPAEYAATTKAKRAGMKKGQQFVPQPETVAKKVRRYRRNPSALYPDIPDHAPRTAAFKRWFGGSKVVDSRGKPLVVFHGSRRPFAAFNYSRWGQTDPGFAGKGFYFIDHMGFAKAYAEVDAQRTDQPTVVAAYLRMETPLFVQEFSEIPGATDRVPTREQAEEMQRRVRALGYDGIVVKGKPGNPSEYVVFEPSQVKAVDNVGTFDRADPNMRRNAYRRNPVQNIESEGVTLEGAYGTAEDLLLEMALREFAANTDLFFDLQPPPDRERRPTEALRVETRRVLRSLGIDPKARGYGIDYLLIRERGKGSGSRVVREIEQTLRDEGEQVVFLVAARVFAHVRHARGFWARMGYTEVPGNYEPLEWEGIDKDNRIMFKVLGRTNPARRGRA